MFHLLGPLEIRVDDRRIRVDADKPRTILAMLLAHAGRVVPIRSLLLEVWGDDPPRSAVQNLRTYILQLRRLLAIAELGTERLVTSRGGYLLRVDDSEFDVRRFEMVLDQAHEAVRQKRLDVAATAFEQALAMWRGRAAEDVTLGPALHNVVANLTNQHMTTVEAHAEARLALGDNPAVVRDLRRFVSQYPLRERIYGQLMLALYRCGDVSGALDVYAEARRALADELGVDPGPELVRIHESILRRDPALILEPSSNGEVRIHPHQLPPAPRVLVGREVELRRIRSGLCASRVVVIHGQGGIGKSGLALRAAHSVARLFPDGQLYVDMQGATAGLAPLHPEEALGRFLRALGVHRAELPTTLAEATAMYQSLLAKRRILIVLDNVAGATQVAPLLPANRGSAVLITSRTILPTLDTEPIALRVLDEAESVALLELLVGRQRVAAERDAARGVVRCCGGLPLALRIVGARLAGRPDWPIARFGERLRDHRRRLDELRAADLDIRSCFSISHEMLRNGTEADRAFRLLGTLDVPEFSTELVAELLGVDPMDAERAIDELVDVRLLEPATAGRVRMHDLLRLYATELAVAELPAEDRSKALRRALDWYLRSCRTVVDALESATTARPRSLSDAVRWLDTELPCLVAAAGQAAEGTPEVARFVVDLLTLVRSTAAKRGYWGELETLARLALRATRRHGDWAGEVRVLAVSATIEWRAGRVDAAEASMRRGLSLSREHDHRCGQARALHNLGWLKMRTGDPAAAFDHTIAALRLLDEDDDPAIVTQFRHNLGEILLQLGRYAEAADCLAQCLASRRTSGDRLGEGVTLAGLGRAYCLLGRHRDALTTLDDAVLACRETGNREDEWEALLCRSEIRLRGGGDVTATIADLAAARRLAAQVGDAYGKAAVSRVFAKAYAAAGDPGRSAAAARLADELFADPAVRPDPVLERVLAG